MAVTNSRQLARHLRKKFDRMEFSKSDAEMMPPPATKPKVPETNINQADEDVEFPLKDGPQRARNIGIPRQKVALQPGFSPMDWAALKASGKDLRGGIAEMKRYTAADLLQHNKITDLWMAYRGKVYNVTPYVNYHPGGVNQLTRGAGKDATNLITRTHPWVNVELMLDRCMIGYLITE